MPFSIKIYPFTSWSKVTTYAQIVFHTSEPAFHQIGISLKVILIVVLASNKEMLAYYSLINFLNFFLVFFHPSSAPVRKEPLHYNLQFHFSLRLVEYTERSLSRLIFRDAS